MSACPDVRRWMLAAMALMAICVARPAHASSGEQEMWFGAGADEQIRTSVHGRYLFDLSDFWSVGGGLEHRVDGPLSAGRSAVLAELRMVIDALTYVPALSLVGGAGMGWPGAKVNGIVRLEGSVAWRPARKWGLMLRLGAERSLVAGAATTVMVSLAWGRYMGGAADLDI
jgi:hypothetical protein